MKKLLKEITTSRTYKYIVSIGLAHANAFLIGLFIVFYGIADSITKNSINASGGAAVMGSGLFILFNSYANNYNLNFNKSYNFTC